MTNGYPPQAGQSGDQPPPGRDHPQGSPGYPPQGPPPPSQQGGAPPQYPQHPQQQGGYGQYPQGPTPYATGPSGPRANFGQRLGAYILDALIIFVPLLILFGALLAGSVESFDAESGQFRSGPLSGGNVLFTLFGLAVSIAYFTLLEGSTSGQTVGKKALSIRVIHANTGGTIGYGRALGRNAVRSLPGLIPLLSLIWVLLDNLWMLWDKEKQTLHDKAASTLVVPVAAYPIRRQGDQGQGGYGQSYGPQQGGYQQQSGGYGRQGYGQAPGGPPPGRPPGPPPGGYDPNR
ncbi:MAG: RDD family protein [Actinomycetota bacterium]